MCTENTGGTEIEHHCCDLRDLAEMQYGLVEQGEKCIEGSGDGKVHDMFNRACVLECQAHQSSGLEGWFKDGHNQSVLQRWYIHADG